MTRVGSRRAKWRDRSDRSRARVIGAAVAIVGVLDIASAITPELRERVEWLDQFVTPAVRDVASGAAALSGVVLIFVGRGLAHRRRPALWLAVAVLVISGVSHLVKGLDVEESAITFAAAGALLTQRRLFHVAAPPARCRTVLVDALLVVAAAYAYGAVGLVVRHRNVMQPLTPRNVVEEISARLVGMHGDLTVSGRFGHWFPASVTAFACIAAVVLLIVLLAPVARSLPDPAAPRRVAALMEREDGDTLDPFSLRSDKHHVFSPDGRAAVAYRYVNGVGLMSGDPSGDPASFPAALAAFVGLCETCGWRVAALGARRDRLTLYESMGLRGLYLGDEAVIDVADFTLATPAMKPVRQATNRTIRHGITCEIHREAELDPTLRRALIGIADRDRANEPERGFSMALDGLLDGRHPECVVVVARDHDGMPIAFQRYAPCKNGRALSLDAMRRDAVPINGVNERMIVEAVRWAAANDVREVSLNFAVGREILAGDAAPHVPVVAEAWFLRRLSKTFQIESLLAFNAKFQPRWVARYLVYRSTADLVPVAIAALSAEAFLPLDRARNPSLGSSGRRSHRRRLAA